MKTLQDWLNKYYPVDAQTFVASLPEGMTKLEKDIALVKHALKKWKGAEKESLREYDLEFRFGAIREDDGEDIFEFNSITCTLCVKYFDTDNATCEECPLNIARNARCDLPSPNSGQASPYSRAVLNKNPTPMIRLLEEVLASLEHQHEEMTRK